MTAKQKLAIKSAETVSAIRAVANKEKDPTIRCNDYLAHHFLGSRYRLLTGLLPQWIMKTAIEWMSPGSYGFIITRTSLFDRILEQEIANGVSQVVVLGAGYDSRAFRFAEKLKGIKVFELDFPGTQMYKRKKLATLVRQVPENIVFIPIDFNEQSFDRLLLKKGFSTQKKTVFLWEGVSYYLPEAVVKKVLCFVSSCREGSSIVFDYATRDFVNGDVTSFGGKQISKWLKKIDEPFLFGLNANQTSGFLRKCNLTIVNDYSPEDLENLYLVNMKGKKPRRTLGHVRMVHAKV